METHFSLPLTSFAFPETEQLILDKKIAKKRKSPFFVFPSHPVRVGGKGPLSSAPPPLRMQARPFFSVFLARFLFVLQKGLSVDFFHSGARSKDRSSRSCTRSGRTAEERSAGIKR